MLNSIGNRISFLRRKNKLSKLELAEKLKIPGSELIAFEQDKKTPSIEILVALSNIFKTTLDFIIKNNEIYSKEEYEKHAEHCFDKLKKMIGKDKYEEFCQKYKFIEMKNGCFCFSVMDKDLFNLHYNTKYEDSTIETLIGSISMKIDKRINGCSFKLDESLQNI